MIQASFGINYNGAKYQLSYNHDPQIWKVYKLNGKRKEFKSGERRYHPEDIKLVETVLSKTNDDLEKAVISEILRSIEGGLH